MKKDKQDAREQGRFASVSAFRFLLITGVAVALGLLATRSLFENLPTAHASDAYRPYTVAGEDAVLEARQVLERGDAPAPADETAVSVQELAGSVRLLRAESRVGEAVVSQVEAVGSFVPAPRAAPASADELPRVAGEVVERLLADPRLEVRRVREDTRIAGETLSGLVVVSPGVELRLHDVVVVGALVSEGALTDASFADVPAGNVPAVIVEGMLRLEPMDALPGVSVVMPDGVLTCADEHATLQIEGDVVAGEVTLRGRGSLFGQVASLHAPDISAGVDRVRQGRVPRPWSEALDMRGGLRTDYFTYLPDDTGWQDVQPMIGFQFP